MFARVLLSLVVATTLVAALVGCADDGDDEGTTDWWAELVSYLPADLASEGLYLADIDGARERFGISRSTDCESPTVPISEDDDQVLDDLYAALRPSDWLLIRILPNQEELIGFEACRVKRLASAGGVSAYEPDVDTDEIRDRLAARAYVERVHGGSIFLSLGDDEDSSGEAELDYLNSLLSGETPSGTVPGINRILVEDRVVVRAHNDRDIEASIDARQNRSQSAYLELMLDSLGTFHGAYLPTFPPERLEELLDLDRAIGRIGGLGLTTEQVDTIRNELRAQFTQWSGLPAFSRVAFAYERTEAGTNEMKVALLYDDRAIAVRASTELQTRLSGYEGIFSGQDLCESGTVKATVVSEQAKHVVVAICTTRNPGTWLRSVGEGEVFYLAEFPPQ